MSSAGISTDGKFEALITADDAAQILRNDLPGNIRGIQQCVMLCAMDKTKIVDFIEARIRDEGEIGVLSFLETVTGFVEWSGRLSELAQGIEDRVLCAMAHAVDPSDNEPLATDPLRTAWDAALAEHDRQFSRFETLGDYFTDEAIKSVTADYSPARETLIGTPAPDLPALQRKFEVMWLPDQGMCGNPDEMDAAEFYKDLRRLAAGS